jgi:hypothetical protein
MAELKQKLYAYVDETGQDTKGAFFLVAVVVADEQRDAFLAELERIEKASGKGVRKWHGSGYEPRLAYFRTIISSSLFTGASFFSRYHDSGEYLSLTVYTTAQAILQKARAEYHAVVTVDGLQGENVRRFAKRLRRLHIHVEKVRGGREQSDALLRLADAFCGLIRDALEGNADARSLYEQARSQRIIKEL